MASSSTVRTRSISGSSVIGLDDEQQQPHQYNHHHLHNQTSSAAQQQQHQNHHHQHHHQHHHIQQQQQQQQQHQPDHPHQSAQHHSQQHSSALPSQEYVLANMTLLQNFGSSLGGSGVGYANSSSSAMNLSQISAVSSSSSHATDASSTAATTTSAARGGPSTHGITHNIGGSYVRFPKLEECAHFHYERVQLGQILLRLIEDRSDLQSTNNTTIAQHVDASATANPTPPGGPWFIIRVTAEKSDPFLIRRSLDNLRMLDEMLHRCVYDRKISGLQDFRELREDENPQLENLVAAYLNRFSNIMTDSLTCGPVLTWFQLDNKGRRLPLADMDTMKSINTPAVGAAYGIRKYQAQAVDEISIEVGDMISVIDMPSPAESTWWRGKKSHLQKSHYEVGFFPQTCVATIGDKVPRNLVLPAPLVGSLAVSPTKPVLRKHGKLIAFFRSFILSRPSRRRLKQSGIYKERVFSCDLSEHLLNSGQEIPMVLRCCAEFIEESGIVDGIYRLSGITSNIQKLRRSFDEERIPDFSLPDVRQDIHAMSSLLKMYFRELPNPLCTFQLYDNFVDAIQTRGDATERLRLMKETVQKLPPPHYRTLKYLAKHLNKIAQHHKSTGMTDRNLAIVWAPNLLRSPALETGDDYISGVAALRGVGVQAVVTEYLITNCALIFDSAGEDYDRYESLMLQYDSLTDSNVIGGDESAGGERSSVLEQRDHHDHSLYIERPKSLSVGGPKLISLEEARETRRDPSGRHHGGGGGGTPTAAMPMGASQLMGGIGHGHGHAAATTSAYIEVGGGPSSLPDKYHTVLPVPRSWSKRKTHSWKSLFTRNQQQRSGNGSAASSANAATVKKTLTISYPCPLDTISCGGGGGVSGSVAAVGSHGVRGGASHPIGASAQSPSAVGLHHSMLTGAKSIDVFDSMDKHQLHLQLQQQLHQQQQQNHHHHQQSNADQNQHQLQQQQQQPMDVSGMIMRSTSVDSLRTVGHSRSVSHDSYFDLLQSPLRSVGGPSVIGGQSTMHESRELSELGLNFDREESEMRIFSESESLVSSPRPGKESSRRSTTTRSRADNPQTLDSAAATSLLSATTHQNGNPSPKKLARLSNIPSASGNNNGALLGQHPITDDSTTMLIDDESLRKRYKLEDQLSDIQYIDCNTPEHHCGSTNSVHVQPPPGNVVAQLLRPQSHTIYASVQIHNPPPPSSSSSSTASVNSRCSGRNPADPSSTTAIRYSYPGNKIASQQHQQQLQREDRFSYPGRQRKHHDVDDAPRDPSGKLASAATTSSSTRSIVNKHPGRFSYCSGGIGGPNAVDFLSRSNSTADVTHNKANNPNNDTSVDGAIDQQTGRSSKLSIPTPSTPGQSPRYSLLAAETSSSNDSSAIGTPCIDMAEDDDGTSSMGRFGGMMLLPPQHEGGGGRSSVSPSSLVSAASSRTGHHASQQQHPKLHSMHHSTTSAALQHQQQQLPVGEAMSASCPTPPTSSPQKFQPQQQQQQHHRDIAQIKRELSLDLINTTGGNNNNASGSMRTSLHQQHFQQQRSTPNTPNLCTTETSGGGNTSQSITPSEYGYHNLSASRQSTAVSPALSLSSSPTANRSPLLPASPAGSMDRSFGGVSGDVGRMSTSAVGVTSSSAVGGSNPIRSSTINITYNLRSPVKTSDAAAMMAVANADRNGGDQSETHENVFFCSAASASSSAHNTIGSQRAQTDASADYELVSVVTVDATSLAAKNDSSVVAADKPLPLLETSFDENMVYEQVKFFKGAVSEINSMLIDNGNQQQRSVVVDGLGSAGSSSMEADSGGASDGDGGPLPQVVPNIATAAAIRCDDDECNDDDNDYDDDDSLSIGLNGRSTSTTTANRTPLTPLAAKLPGDGATTMAMTTTATTSTSTSATNDKSSTTSTISYGGVHATGGGGGGGGGSNNSEESTDADVPMHDQELDDIQDSLELDANVSLYENVELRRPPSVYENIDVTANAGGRSTNKMLADTSAAGAAGFGGVSPLHRIHHHRLPTVRPSTFHVRQLANKFETTSPTGCAPTVAAATATTPGGASMDDALPPTGAPFDFSRPSFGRRFDSNRNSSYSSFGATAEQNTNGQMAAGGGRGVGRGRVGESETAVGMKIGGSVRDGNGHGVSKITRSLDENAFVREFGSHRQASMRPMDVTKSVQMVAAAAEIGGDARRMSMEFSRPKTLNQPKRLPELEDCVGGDGIGGGGGVGGGGVVAGVCEAALLELCKADKQKLLETIASAAKYERITPTTENPISLIQHNVKTRGGCGGAAAVELLDTSKNAVVEDDRSGSGATKVLGGCKLDRERIERIKEERRLQLNEKFRSGSTTTTDSIGVGVGVVDPMPVAATIDQKSKSRVELRDLKDDPMIMVMVGGTSALSSSPSSQGVELRFKSKSRADVRSSILRDSRESLNHLSSSATEFAGQQRVRRISDERNQNDCAEFGAGTPPTVNDSVSSKARKFDANKPITGVASGGLSLQLSTSPSTAMAATAPVAVPVVGTRLSMGTQRERISPQFNIRDVAAMFESKSQQ